jgi:anti-sigma28 factor (negative regulator of flagellin synthesis)
MGRSDIPKDPVENIKRLESIRTTYQASLKRKEEELARKRAQCDAAENGVHRELLQRRADQLVFETTELALKIQWNIDQVERIKDSMADGSYELTHRPLAALANVNLDPDVHLDTDED